MPDRPLAYFLTFRCYGTWLPGDRRGFFSIGSRYGTPAHEPSRGLERDMRKRSSGPPVRLDPAQRSCVESSVAETCAAIGWTLLAVNARSNHIHVIVAGVDTPERILNSLKSWATRSLRNAGLLAADIRPWSRHGSTVYLWAERDVDAAYDYVVYGQDKADEPGG
ncbi:MAG: hypothetical protein ACRDG3_08630 [Tepidiformaceae bacterium]